MVTGFICWNILGVLVGFLAGKLLDRRTDDPRPGLVASAAGAAIGGMIFHRLRATGLTEFDRWSLLAAAFGAVVVVAAWHRMHRDSNHV